MSQILPIAFFYCFILIYGISLFRYRGEGPIVNFEDIKYHFYTILFFFININIVFFCGYCEHCYSVCMPMTVVAVTFGALSYLIHLYSETVAAILLMFERKKFSFMAPFFAIPYFYLVYDIGHSLYYLGLESLHLYENKMLIVLLYPFFITLGELTGKMK